MLDVEEEVAPAAVEQQQLLLEAQGDALVTRLDQEVPRVVHVHVLLDPVGQVPEEILAEG